jgi:hypothetical protein
MNGLCNFCFDKSNITVYQPEPTKQICDKCRKQIIDKLYKELAVLIGIEDDIVHTHSTDYELARAQLKQSEFRFDDMEKLR